MHCQTGVTAERCCPAQPVLIHALRLEAIECRGNDYWATMSNHCGEEVARTFGALGIPTLGKFYKIKILICLW